MPIISRLRRHMSFAEAAPRNDATKHQCGRQLIEHLCASGVKLEATLVGNSGCSFVIDSRDAQRLATAAEACDVALTLRDRCARVALTRNSTDWPLPSLDRVVRAFDEDGIALVHLAGDGSGLTVVVDDREADRVATLFARFYAPTAC